jgi:asparagine synthase (glutamine-hydrolysing)
MCGIVGILNKNKKITLSNESICKKMLQMISYRGPDENNILNHQNFSCGVTRLAIESINNGAQPIENKRYIAGFNGEIFNYKDLIKSYGFTKDINSEIKLILKLFDLKKLDFIHEIKGQFAIFIYDKNSEEIFLFRDRYGIRPIYYFFKKNYFLFGSEIKTIVSSKIEKFTINPSSLEDTAVFWTNISDSSSIKDIRLLEPGCYLRIRNNKIFNGRYFINPILSKKNNNLSLNKSDFLKKFQSAIKNQIHGEVGHACYLSGGVDSAALAFFLNKYTKKKLDTFSIEFSNKEYDESIRQKYFSKLLKTNHRSIKVDKKDIANNFEIVINHAETFLFRTAPVPLYLLSKFVKNFNHKVIFTGEGADEVLFGYDIFFENRIRQFWRKNKKSKIRYLLFKKLYNYLPQFNNDRYFDISKDFYKKFLINHKSKYFSHLVRWSQFDQISKYFNFHRDQKTIIKDYISSLDYKFRKISNDRRAQFFEFDTLLSNYLLSSQGDRMSLANSIEGRYPFLDEDFTEYCSRINSKDLALGIKSKSFFRNSLKKFIPSNKIIYQPKVAYQAPEAKSFLDHNFISIQAEEFLDNLNKLDLINKKNFDGLIKKIRNKFTSNRLGFRENMSFILGISYYYLQKNIEKWQKK